MVCDTTALMTAVYSGLLFNDHSLEAYAITQQRRCALTLLTALDIAWVADGLQRDGPQVRTPVDDRVRALLIGHQIPWSLVSGQGDARVEAAVDAVAPLLRQHGIGGSGLFSRLSARDAAPAGRAWLCGDCDDADGEHQSRQPR